ncbi:type II toxin-antitoxin system RelE/ParE family toxin [Serratia quinivorans]|jgi:plasmid stabilization system protein ParE|uniref:type II toxin-antitoxin system RelE/ParE family toxin n=1 Tax=Serratia quinivorans TaxID=137545 RepID=UPI00217A4AE1|nr:type II toxin-antitoxin system RelE/ParE family toxin [Serratia quinivorans]CAI1069487.1 Plasmid stabilisation system protein [Serratia quinivorans]CAI1902308.1 Plasmid stabilisation system protein [Serratia quinivorans]
MYDVHLTNTALQCLSDIESFKAITLGPPGSARFVDTLFAETLEHLRVDPLRCRYNAQLAEFGLAVRERLDRHDYRTLYEVTENRVDILLILHTRQDIGAALWRHMLLN